MTTGGATSPRLSRWGVGPRIGVPASVCAVAAWTATLAWPAVFRIPDGWRPICLTLGFVLLAAGLAIWLSGVFTVMRAYNRDQLVKTGVLSLVQHPIYSAWIVFLIPALALLSRSWPMFLAALVAFAIFRRLIHVEEDYLLKRFGQPYLEYQRRVNRLIPWPRAD